MDKTNVIVCAPSGTGLSDAAGKLVGEINKQSQVSYQDLEECLMNLEETDSALDLIKAPKERKRMRAVTTNLPKNKVIDLWNIALENAVSKLSKENSQIRILSCHLSLYSQKRREYYSPVKASAFTSIDFKPTHVLLLIDDIYDMFARLSEKNHHLFGSQIRDNDIKDELKREGYKEPFLPNSQEYQSGLFRWRINTLTRILEWRYHETVFAENLAYQLGAKFLAVSVKQLIKMPALWIADPLSRAIYVSHPISKLRKEQQKNKNGEWDGYVATFQELQERLVNGNILAVMPTGIDEFRFFRKNDQEETPHLLTGQLTDRWPLPTKTDMTDEFSHLLYAPTAHDLHFREILTQGVAEVSQQDKHLQVVNLSGNISRHISSRDHLIVAHADSFFVYRPLYKDPEYSRGVYAEISHFHELIKLYNGQVRKIAYIHYKEDILSLAQKIKERDDISVVQQIAMTLVLKEGRLTASSAARALRNKAQGELEQFSPEELSVSQNRERYFREATAQYILQESQIPWNEDDPNEVASAHSIGVWILEDDAHLWASLAEISNFLNNPIAVCNAGVALKTVSNMLDNDLVIMPNK